MSQTWAGADRTRLVAIGQTPTLVLDESLLLQAVKTLADLESEGERFELLNVSSRFASENYVASRFASEVGEEWGIPEKRAVDQYVAAIFLVSHHSAELSDIGTIEREFPTATVEFIRKAAWAFLTAWNLRYGGLMTNLRVDGSMTLIDPSLA